MDYYKAEKVIGQAGCKNFNIITKLPKLDKSTLYLQKKIRENCFKFSFKTKKKKFICITF